MSKSRFDKLGERLTRKLAGYSSRRSFIARVGMALAVAPVLPLLPVARASAADTPAPKTDFERNAQANDATKCSYWKYCAADGVLCSCCGGGSHTCPPGAEPSPISWIGTCVNPEDSRSYIVAYRDCCGKPVCSAGKSCRCDGADRELPTYRAQLNNDIIWCFGNASASYHCSTAALVGLAG
ncbi:MAG: Amine dehydrogenase [Gammaproteobacteria bacterium]|nr:Amine dehydrogenase [Gammaproteobacteria bacterium]